ncbi:WD40-repeat-containing domain protein [Irpex rosettiformis]|uniref:WD40-repeat-containing domain protein n=1 Tax=Irpex rosettiformis TaxID=378272 RepID=A0ACB8UK59_9APHY|nr:WD40-repeat-containing domain protein [Irpex rosettiformis]
MSSSVTSQRMLQQETNIVSTDAQPWYRQHLTSDSLSPQPFVLTKFITPRGPTAPPFLCVAAFPWHLNSLTDESLYDISAAKIAELQSHWKASITPWLGSILVGSIGQAWIFRKAGPPLCLQVPPCSDEHMEKSLGRHVKCAAWALDPRSWTAPLVVLAAFGMVFVYDPMAGKLISSLRGHGGEITSIATHHMHPYRFLTSSRDHTTRLYDLRFAPRKGPNNPPWPPSKRPSRAGTGFGLHITGSEGDGFGRCIAVLAGGRSGGHQAAVLHAAWHPTEDLIATCGADRAVKIWRTPYVDYKKVYEDTEHLAREDKPLFTTDLIHDARVLSVWWLSHDILISHSAPALMRGKSVHHMYEEPGTVAVWQWLGYDRYLGVGGLRPVMKGSCDDWRNSRSFKLLSVYSVPMTTPSIYVASSPSRKHDPLLLVPAGNVIRIFNIARLNHRDKPLFPLDGETFIEDEDEELEHMTSAMQLGSFDLEEERAYEVGFESEESFPPAVYKRRRPEKKLFEQVHGWMARHDGPRLPTELPNIEKCQLAFGQHVILGIGGQGSLYSWKLA